MSNKKKVIREFQNQYYDRMRMTSKKRISTNVTSERRIMVDRLDTMIKLVEPERIFRFRSKSNRPIVKQDPRVQETLGRFRYHETDRKCVTDDMDIIQFYSKILNTNPPSFVEAGPRELLFHDPLEVRVGLLTSGGIAPGLNTVIEAIVDRHCEIHAMHAPPSHKRSAVIGFLDGFIGLTDNLAQPLHPGDVEGWCRFGGSKLGVGRTYPNLDRWMEVLQQNQIDILYVIGGNGSLTAAHDIAQLALKRKLNMSVAVIPKTMDNDVLWIWQSFGFVTAVEKATEIINILHTEAESNRRVCVIQLFGAKSGHVAANASLASGEVDAVLIPEEPFEPRLISKHVAQRVNDKKHAVVVMAEGAQAIYRRAGKWYIWAADTREQRDKNFWLLQKALTDGLKGRNLTRYTVFGNQPQHTIRSVVANSHDQVYCRRLADMAVDSCLGGYTDFMISSWLTEYVIVPLVFPAKGGLTQQGYKTFPIGGIFWRTVLRSTGQPPFISPDARKAIDNGQVTVKS